MDGKPTPPPSSSTTTHHHYHQNHRNNTTGQDGQDAQLLHGARRGLLKAIWQATVAPRFQSRPMDLDEYYFGGGGGDGGGGTDPDNCFYPSSSSGDGRQQRTSLGGGSRSSGRYGIGAAAAATGIYSSIAISETYDNDESVTSNTVVETQSPPLLYPYQHPDGRTLSAALASSASSVVAGPSSPPPNDVPSLPQPMPPNLTASETRYLETLLQSDDLDSIRSASVRLADKEIFPVITPPPPPSSPEGGGEEGAATTGDDHNNNNRGTSTSKTTEADTTNTAAFDANDQRETVSPRHQRQQQQHHHHQKRRDSLVQQQLFELHEKTTIMPSVALRRMSSAGCAGGVGCSPGTAAGIGGGGGGPLARRRARFQSKPLRFDSHLGDDEKDGDEDFYDHGSFVVHSESGGSTHGGSNRGGDNSCGGGGGERTTVSRSIRMNNSLTQDDESSKTATSRSTDLRNSKQKKDEKTSYQNGDNAHNGIQEEKSSKETMLLHNVAEANVVAHQSELNEDDNSKNNEGEDSVKGTIEGRLSWNPLKDANEWIDGNEGIEVDDDGPHDVIASGSTSNPFKILGTSANDTSCHPHVLSPPLMEGLQMFMPESLQDYHYWLKYSLVRDGPGLLKMLRHCRASQHTVLAIETTDGHVFGSFTSHPWRLKATKSPYGSKDSFVWKMRRSRTEKCESIMEQILMESKIDVFPFTGRNNVVQVCTMAGISLGSGELGTDDDQNQGTTDEKSDGADLNSDGSLHFGNAIHLEKFLDCGTTSSSETFNSPPLISRENRAEKFDVVNIELWSMTPHETVQDADKAEMQSLFQQSDNNLNLLEILVGGTRIA
mmetsp:Transcript_57104/g.139156  ORF Transcript_57104/g.139156 Transcript_57104/m.139156 type:complete len:831 (-) Transcript_57104:57-2549(-)